VSVELAVAIAAAALAALAMLSTLTTWSRLRALRRGQQAILGGSTTDVVDFAVSLQGRIDDLHRAVDEVAAGLTRVDRRLDGALTNTSVVRYDAYEDAGGQQSASFAFLDSSRTGTVVTAIQGRDYARVYVKELERGKPSLALSPEEAEAVERAMAREAWGNPWFPHEPPPPGRRTGRPGLASRPAEPASGRVGLRTESSNFRGPARSSVTATFRSTCSTYWSSTRATSR
jgi:Protein of unknown function (DUF4446)